MLTLPRAKTYPVLLCLFLIGAAFLAFYSFYSFQSLQEYRVLKFLTLEVFAYFLLGICGYALFKLRRANMRNENSLRLLKSRMAAIEAAGDGIGILDKEGNITYANQALWNIYGIPEKQKQKFLGQYWGNLYTEKGRDIIAKTVMPHMAVHKSWAGTSPILRQDGKVAMAELSLRLLEDGSMIGTTRDISESYNAENERKELEKQFFQAQKMEAVGRLAGGIAHDFNNILAAINGYAEFLTEDLPEPSRQKNYALNILKATQQARKVVDQILAFSRQKQSGMEKLDIVEPLQEAFLILEATLPKTINLHKHLNAKHTAVEGNEAQIGQAIMNLCVNARDAIDEVSNERGTITITLSNLAGAEIEPDTLHQAHLPETSHTPPIVIENMEPGRTLLSLGKISTGRDYVCLSVQDTGPGISRSVMENMFEPFYTTKSVDKGTGLGLATVHGIITSHQGAVVVDSTIGAGSSFRLYLPLSERALDTPQIKKPQALKPQHQSGHILVVEDMEQVRLSLMETLERLGYDTCGCGNGREAMERLREEPERFNLVLTDQNMPEMTGLELVQAIHPELPGMPFILISGYSQERLQSLMTEHPAIKATLRKPVSKDHLAATLDSIIGQEEKAA